jgi:hypothetical protein
VDSEYGTLHALLLKIPEVVKIHRKYDDVVPRQRKGRVQKPLAAFLKASWRGNSPKAKEHAALVSLPAGAYNIPSRPATHVTSR